MQASIVEVDGNNFANRNPAQWLSCEMRRKADAATPKWKRQNAEHTKLKALKLPRAFILSLILDRSK